MNEATIYRDDFSQVFGQESAFLGFLREREQSAGWNKQASNTLRFEALDEDSSVTQLLLDNYAMGGREGILKDTMENTRLLLKASERYYPVRGCAVKTILDRARVSGSALSRVKKPVLAQILNECMKVASGDALLRIADDKVSAVLGGDSSDYAILEMPALFEDTMGYLQKRFPGYTFAGGWFDHSMVTALWELTATPELVESYQRALALHGYKPEELKPALRLTSSDVGLSGSRIAQMEEKVARALHMRWRDYDMPGEFNW